ncbi:hypothetical protein VB737_00350 [Synechococcus sp. BA-120 BA3]|nr:hypothetical protein [Synechococcus sp. BA-120 BA3]
MAKTGFDVYFDAAPGNKTSLYSTGVTAKLSFDFKVNPNDSSTYLLDLGISNTSPASGKSSSTLVGLAFNEPLKSDNKSEAISLLGYNPLVSGYERVFGGISNPNREQRNQGALFIKDNNKTLTGNSTAPYKPFAPFDFCARVSSSSGCHGGSGDKGIVGGKTVNVQFTLKSNDPNIATADQVAERFFNLFNQYTPTGNNWKDAQIALRFQDVITGFKKSGKPEVSKNGEKVTGFAKWRVID